jgi:Kef-type K+ transport system membrane component KefB
MPAMNPTLQLLLLLGIIIFAAKTGGLLSTRLGQPAVLGELLAGLMLGPTVVDLLGQPLFAEGHVGEIILELGELGVIFLMFAAGLEVELEEMMRSGRVALFAGVLGVIVPLVLGAAVALGFGHPLQNSLFIGLILTATSVSISAQTLLELGYLKSKEGLALLGAAVVDDVLVIILLSVMLALAGEAGSTPSIGIVLVRVIVFIGVATLIGLKVLPRLVDWVKRLPVSEGVMAFVVVVTLLYAWSAEVFGMVAAITGAFLAGVYFARTSIRGAIERGMHSLTYAFFVPIFLISIGLKANARVLDASGVWFAVVIIVVAIVGKIGGCGLGAFLSGFDWRESLRVGIGMISRGEVGLIVAAVALGNQMIDQAIYSAMVVMVLATTLITPLLLRQAFPQKEVTGG